MSTARIIMLRGSSSEEEDWGEWEFLSLPSAGDRIMVRRDGAENYATVLSTHHNPCAAGSGEKPSAEVVAKWTGSAPKLR